MTSEVNLSRTPVGKAYDYGMACRQSLSRAFTNNPYTVGSTAWHGYRNGWADADAAERCVSQGNVVALGFRHAQG